jgi:hypothetical protein
MNLEEAILDNFRHLPQAKQEEVLRFADGLHRQNASGPDQKRDRATERIWIERNRASFAGQWVAVEGDRLVASGTDALKVFAAAKSEGIESPFVVHILVEDSLPFVPGW